MKYVVESEKIFLKKCPTCDGDRLYLLNNSILCINCEHIHEIISQRCDKLSFWLWEKQYKKRRKE